MSQTRDQFAQHAAAVARDLYGEPNKQLSTKDELRFGAHGSISVDVKTGQFYDHEQKEGGGVLWAVERMTGKTAAGGHAVEWMRQNGFDIEDDRPPAPRQQQARLDAAGNWLPQRVPDHGRLTATYDYRDAAGDLVYQVCRYDWEAPSHPKGREKTFVQRRPDAGKRNGWSYSVRDVAPLPYRLPELLDDIRGGFTVFMPEGEKKVDMLRELGVPATCNSGGAGKFTEGLIEYFRGADIVILPDDDPQARTPDGQPRFHPDGRPVMPGHDHAQLIARRLKGVARRVRILQLPDLPPKGGVDDWIPAGGTAEKLYDLTGKLARLVEVEAYQSRFGAVQWLDFDAPGPTYEYLIKGVLTRNEVSMLLGASQSGKSFLAIEVAMCVARGVDFFGHKARQGGVIYQAGESAAGVRRKRFPAYRRHYNVGRDPLPVVLLEQPVDFYNSDEQVDAFIEECRYWGGTFNVPLELIVIDTFNKATPGANENDGKDMGMVLARCDRVRRATGANVMLVHHMNADGTKARGHTSLFANVENVILVRKVPDSHDGDGRQLREWVVSKQKEGEDGKAVKFVLPQVEIGTDADGDPITSCIVAPPERGDQPDDDSPHEGVNVSGFNAVVLREIYTGIEKAGTLAPSALGLSRGAMALEARPFWGAVKETLAADDIDPENDKKPGETVEEAAERMDANLRKKIQRARDDLLKRGLIARGKADGVGYMWLTGKRARGFQDPPGQGDGSRKRRGNQRADHLTLVEDAPPPADLPVDLGEFQ